jgi:hypothetical protein
MTAWRASRRHVVWTGRFSHSLVVLLEMYTLLWYGTRSIIARLLIFRDPRLKPLRALDVGSWKQGDTVFVLGSGPSIADFSDERWRLVGEHSSIGFNSWTEHWFVPNLYVFENIHPSLIQALYRRSDDYRDVPVLLKHHLGVLPLIKNSLRGRSRLEALCDRGLSIYLSSDIPVRGVTAHQVRTSLRVLARLGLLRTDRERFQWVPIRTASIFFLTALAARAGFRRVVLCGVDLSSGYFHRPEAGQVGRQAGGVHATEDRATKSVPISEAMAGLSEAYLQGIGVELYVSDRSSPLAAFLPVFKWSGCG